MLFGCWCFLWFDSPGSATCHFHIHPFFHFSCVGQPKTFEIYIYIYKIYPFPLFLTPRHGHHPPLPLPLPPLPSLLSSDYHFKGKRLKALYEKARNKNPDEYYHAMVKAKTKDGVHIDSREGRFNTRLHRWHRMPTGALPPPSASRQLHPPLSLSLCATSFFAATNATLVLIYI